jgi:hypothetical protein
MLQQLHKIVLNYLTLFYVCVCVGGGFK